MAAQDYPRLHSGVQRKRNKSLRRTKNQFINTKEDRENSLEKIFFDNNEPKLNVPGMSFKSWLKDI